MIRIRCYNGIIQELSMETTINEPIYIGGVPTNILYLEIRPHEQYLYINGIRAKALPGGAHYQMIEPVLFSYLDEICQLFDRDTGIFVDDESYLPFIIRVEGTNIFAVENVGTTFYMDTKIGLDDIRNISSRIERTFRLKIIPLLKEVGLYD